MQFLTLLGPIIMKGIKFIPVILQVIPSIIQAVAMLGKVVSAKVEGTKLENVKKHIDTTTSGLEVLTGYAKDAAMLAEEIKAANPGYFADRQEVLDYAAKYMLGKMNNELTKDISPTDIETAGKFILSKLPQFGLGATAYKAEKPPVKPLASVSPENATSATPAMPIVNIQKAVTPTLQTITMPNGHIVCSMCKETRIK